jgi:hypothetical protein
MQGIKRHASRIATAGISELPCLLLLLQPLWIPPYRLFERCHIDIAFHSGSNDDDEVLHGEHLMCLTMPPMTASLKANTSTRKYKAGL